MKSKFKVIICFLLCMSLILQPVSLSAMDNTEDGNANNAGGTEQDDDLIFEPDQFKVKLDITDGRGTIKIADDKGNESVITDADNESWEMNVETGTILSVEIIPESGFCISTYRILTDSGDIVEEIEDAEILNAEESYKKEIEVIENLTIETVFNENNQSKGDNEGKESTEEEDESEETDSDVDIDRTSLTKEGTRETSDLEALFGPGEGEEDTRVSARAWRKFQEEVGIMPLTEYWSEHLQQTDIIVGANYDNGTIIFQWNEGILGINGEPTFCIDATTSFYDGVQYYPTDASSVGLNDTIVTHLALYQEYIYNHRSDLDDTAKYFYTQLLIWRDLNNVFGWNWPNLHIFSGSESWTTVEYQEEVLTSALNWVQEQESTGKYTGHGTFYVCDQWQAQAVFWVTENNGSIEIYKSSSNPELTSNNNGYSLEGAVYGVYTDGNGEPPIATLTTDANGYGKVDNIPAGDYWIQEITPPKGFSLNEKWQQVTVDGGKTATVYSTDTFQWDPVTILLKKVSAEDDSVLIADAEFTVKFYEGLYDVDPATQGQTPVRTWVLKTGDGTNGTEKGTIDLSKGEKYKVSGDDFFYDIYGATAIPIGTITIQETKAPSGYLINSEIFVRQIVGEGTDVYVNTYNAPTVSETPQKIQITLSKLDLDKNKAEKQGAASLEGAVYEIRDSQNQLVDTLVTDASGKATSKKLPLGVYTVKETKASNGYLVDSKTYTVNGSAPKDSTSEVFQYEVTSKEEIIRGGVKIQKRDYETKNATPQGGATLEGATFAIVSLNTSTIIVNGKTYVNGKTVATIKTDKNGLAKTTADLLPYGHYKIVETGAPTGYLNTGAIEVEFDVTENGKLVDLTAEKNSIQNQVIRGGVKIQKRDYETKNATPQGGATLEGAAFDIVSLNTNPVTVNGKSYANGKTVATIQTDKNGLTQTGTNLLPYGHYKIVETAAPTGYLNRGILEVEFDITENGKLVDLTAAENSIQNQVIRGGVKIQKRDYETKNATPQGGATLEGAVFDIVSLNTNPVIVNGKSYTNGKTVATIQTNKNGLAQTGAALLPYGHYKIVETAAPTGYLNTGILEIEFDITENGKIVDLTAEKNSIQNQVIRGGVKIQKRDYDTKDTTPQGAAVLENAVFTITTLSENPVIVNGVSYNKGDVVAVFKTDENGLAQTEDDLLPYGDYQITETGAPTGYLGEGILSREFSIRENKKVVDMTSEENSIQNRVKRGDFELRKIDSDSQDVMANVQFKITSVTTGESHTFTTDVNGYYSSSSDWNKHTSHTNQGGDEDGLWFGLDGEGNSAPVNDELGALPYDTYQIEEIPSEANEGKVMFKGTLVIYKNNVTVNLGNIENKEPDENTPAISTIAKNEATGNHYARTEDSVTIVDSVLYSGLEAQKEYMLKGWLMNRETGEKILGEDGNAVTAEKAFRPAATSGIIEMEYVFDASKLGGADVVVFEELYLGSEKIAEHTDIEDEGQTVHFAEIGTKAADADTNTNMTAAKEEITIVDTVFIKNPKVGEKYTVSGKLIDKETGKAVTDAEGNLVTAETSFTAKTKNGTVDVTFVFDGSKLGGKTLVAFETLEKNGKVYAVHADLEDEDQTIYIPKIGTSAKDQDTGTHEAIAKENTTIVDTVSHEEIVSGEESTVKGILMEKESGKALLIDGKEVTAEKTFTAGSADGEVEMEFTFDASGLNGKSVVVFEKLYWKEIEIASHEDLEDENQTINFPEPKIGTTASNPLTGAKEIIAKENAVIEDRVSYEKMIPGVEFVLKGIVMVQETGMPLLINGEEVTAEVSFVPEKEDGIVIVNFTFDASSLENQKLVVFEQLYMGDILIAAHEDINDKDQTVELKQEETPPATPEDDDDGGKITTTTPGGSDGGGGRTIKTGDFIQWIPIVVMLILASAVIVTICYRKRWKGAKGEERKKEEV